MYERLNKERICTGTVLIFLQRLIRITRSTNSFQCKIVYGCCKFNQTHARRILLSFHQEVFSTIYPRGFPLPRDFSSFHLTCRFSYVGSGVTRNYVQISQLMSGARTRKAVKYIRSQWYFDARPNAAEYIECNLPQRARIKQKCRDAFTGGLTPHLPRLCKHCKISTFA